MKKLNRLVAGHIAEDMPVIAWYEKHRVLLPFEVFLRFAFAGPHGGQAAAGADVNDFIQGEFHRR